MNFKLYLILLLRKKKRPMLYILLLNCFMGIPLVPPSLKTRKYSCWGWHGVSKNQHEPGQCPRRISRAIRHAGSQSTRPSCLVSWWDLPCARSATRPLLHPQTALIILSISNSTRYISVGWQRCASSTRPFAAEKRYSNTFNRHIVHVWSITGL